MEEEGLMVEAGARELERDEELAVWAAAARAASAASASIARRETSYRDGSTPVMFQYSLSLAFTLETEDELTGWIDKQ
jgi:hypothetical protein